jgi:hypothetical protein
LTASASARVIPLRRRPERAQARLFIGILRREIAELKAKAADVESAWRRQCESDGYVDPPEQLAAVRERIAEARRMLNALNSRFPSAARSQ